MTASATLSASAGPGTVTLRAAGEWIVPTAAELDRRLRSLDLPSGQHVTFDLSGVERLDTAGAWLVLRTERALTGRGNTVDVANLNPNFEPLLTHLRADTGVAVPHPVPPHHTLVGFVARIGEVTLRVLHRGYAIVGFLGLVTEKIVELAAHPRRFRGPATIVQMEQTGLDAMPIVGLLSCLIGVVLAYRAPISYAASGRRSIR
jgi:phospholipid/cholesterol/gamma-HCH transport system permease protein